MAKLQEPILPATDRDVDNIEERLAGYRADYSKSVMWRDMEKLVALVKELQQRPRRRGFSAGSKLGPRFKVVAVKRKRPKH